MSPRVIHLTERSQEGLFRTNSVMPVRSQVSLAVTYLNCTYLSHRFLVFFYMQGFPPFVLGGIDNPKRVINCSCCSREIMQLLHFLCNELIECFQRFKWEKCCQSVVTLGKFLFYADIFLFFKVYTCIYIYSNEFDRGGGGFFFYIYGLGMVSILVNIIDK